MDENQPGMAAAIAYFGDSGATKLAARLGVSLPAVLGWLKRERPVPLERCVEIEQATDRTVKCEQLRPDKIEYFEYLRGMTDNSKEVV